MQWERVPPDTYVFALRDGVLPEYLKVLQALERDPMCVFEPGLRDGESVIVNRIRSALERLNYRRDRPYSLGLSIGSIYFDPALDDIDLDALIAQADHRMYKDKARLRPADRD